MHVSRTGYTGDLGYELWVGADGAIEMWDTLTEACTGRGVLPVGQSALLMTRIEAGLVLIGVDFHSSRFAFNDDECSTPAELGFAWMFRDLANVDTTVHRPRRHRTRACRQDLALEDVSG